jgi:hypothetical protein
MPAPAEKPVPTEEAVASEAGPTSSTCVPARVQSTPIVVEIGGPSGPEPTRYGDWEKGGRCIDF